MDNLIYQYERNNSGQLISNRLRYVHDVVQGNSYAHDIKTETSLTLAQVLADNSSSQSGDNYAYDAIGNLIKDGYEGITGIAWTVYGKIATISKSNGTIIIWL